MALVRGIGTWALIWLVVNSIIGSGVFGSPAEFVTLLGPASVIAVIIGGLATAVVVACFAEVASKIPEPGGSYIYARTVFGQFAGIQVGWFSWVTRITSAAASATLFVSYLGGLVPSLEHGVGRAVVLTLLLGGLTLANYIGVRRGANVSSVAAVAKLLPLFAIGIYGLLHASTSAVLVSPQTLAAPGAKNWFEAFLVLSFLYGGFDTAMMPLAEVENPKRTAPIALAVGFLICIAVFTLVQIAVLSTPTAQASTRPLAAVASVMFGPIGAVLTSIAAMISMYGFLSASALGVPRLTYALAKSGDFPSFFARVHPRFNTPHVSILFLGSLTWLVAITGSFRVALALSVGARLVTYGSTCAVLIPLRYRHPERKGLNVPFGPALAVLGVTMSLLLITRVHQREAIALALTALVATVNWWWVRRKRAAG